METQPPEEVLNLENIFDTIRNTSIMEDSVAYKAAWRDLIANTPGCKTFKDFANLIGYSPDMIYKYSTARLIKKNALQKIMAALSEKLEKKLIVVNLQQKKIF